MKHWNFRILAALIIALALLLCLPAAAEGADIPINETTFPDNSFREWCLYQSWGEDGVLTDLEVEETIEINVSSCYNIASLKGIEYFTELQTLKCNNNQISALNISKNTKLIVLECQDNLLTELDLSCNPNIAYLLCSNNMLSALDVSNMSELEFLYCSNNYLAYLNMPANVSLEWYNLE